MILNIFKGAAKSFIGIDIGTSAVKIVELGRSGDRKKLENYGEMQAATLYETPFRTFEKSTLSLSNQDIVKAIWAILAETKIKTKRAFFSIPDFSTFFTTFTLPVMTKEEIPQAVQYEARQHIPLPLSEVTLDWQEISSNKILLVAVPNEIINQYQEIARSAQLELLALEAEVFGLTRALVKNQAINEPSLIGLVDIGARSTTISIVEKGILKISHSFDASGNDFTDLVSRSLNLEYPEAEEFKKRQGLALNKDNARESLLPTIDLVLNEIQKIFQSFYQTEKKEVQKLILAGGSSLLPGLADYFAQNLKKPVEIANPFANIYYPPVLEETLKIMGPSYAIALGAALRGLE